MSRVDIYRYPIRLNSLDLKIEELTLGKQYASEIKKHKYIVRSRDLTTGHIIEEPPIDTFYRALSVVTNTVTGLSTSRRNTTFSIWRCNELGVATLMVAYFSVESGLAVGELEDDHTKDYIEPGTGPLSLDANGEN